jgi:CRP-like cAMP-binding protein
MPDPLRFADVTERTIYLRSIPVTAELPAHIVHVIASQMVPRQFEAGERVMTLGQPFPGLEILTEGRIAISRGEARVGSLAPPQTLGFLDILSRTNASYDAFAEVPTRGMLLETDVFFELLEEHPQMLVATIRYAAERLLYELQELPAELLGFAEEVMPFAITDRPLDFVERILFLRVLSAFKGTNINALAAMAQGMEEIRLPAGSVLFRAGDPAPHGILVVAGHIDCAAPDGRRFRYGPGTAVGGVEATAGKPRWYDAVAADDLVCFQSKTDELHDLMEEDFAMASDFLVMIATGLKNLLARKAAMGVSVTAQKRDVSSLGAVPVGA